MTLQQKLLAKKSKKGFTLVELVVVIAILAILAAIAIPMVVNIINSAQQSSGETGASELNSQIKSFYSAVVAGNIDVDGRTKGDSNANIPEAQSAKTSNARAATVEQALDWAGLSSKYSDDADLVDFHYTTDGNIVYVNTAEGQGNPDNEAGTVTLNTNLGTIYPNGTT